MDKPATPLPCPFCGSCVLHQNKDAEYHVIQCAQCGCEMSHTIQYKLLAAWNRRVPDPHLTAINAELVSALQDATWDLPVGSLARDNALAALARAKENSNGH